MRKLSVEDINKTSPYTVFEDPKSNGLYFVTAHGVQLIVDFVEDDLIHSADCYQFVINNTNNRHLIPICHPNYKYVINEFAETSALLKDKPNKLL